MKIPAIFFGSLNSLKKFESIQFNEQEVVLLSKNGTVC